MLASNIQSPALGRNLMFHPAAYVRGIFAEELDGPVGPVGCAIYSHEFYETDEARGFARGVHLQVLERQGLTRPQDHDGTDRGTRAGVGHADDGSRSASWWALRCMSSAASCRPSPLRSG